MENHPNPNTTAVIFINQDDLVLQKHVEFLFVCLFVLCFVSLHACQEFRLDQPRPRDHGLRDFSFHLDLFSIHRGRCCIALVVVVVVVVRSVLVIGWIDIPLLDDICQD